MQGPARCCQWLTVSLCEMSVCIPQLRLQRHPIELNAPYNRTPQLTNLLTHYMTALNELVRQHFIFRAFHMNKIIITVKRRKNLWIKVSIKWSASFNNATFNKFAQQTAHCHFFVRDINKRNYSLKIKVKGLFSLVFWECASAKQLNFVAATVAVVSTQISGFCSDVLHIKGRARAHLSAGMCPYNCKFKWIQYNTKRQWRRIPYTYLVKKQISFLVWVCFVLQKITCLLYEGLPPL